MTRKIDKNVNLVSHIKEKIVHLDNESQEDSKKLVDMEEDIAKVSLQSLPTARL